MARPPMSPQERAFRSRLAKLVHEEPLLHGTLNPRSVTCGNPGCRCARGERHPALYVVFRREGRVHQVFVPASLEAQVRRWVATDHEVRSLLEEVSRLSVERLRTLKRRM
ncbi:MAG: DUF6788 family protein [Candidatus Deferrimicrobiota bacterium]